MSLISFLRSFTEFDLEVKTAFVSILKSSSTSPLSIKSNVSKIVLFFAIGNNL